MHAFMHYHMTKYAQWNRKVIKICRIKIQFYIILHFYFFLKQCTTNFSKLSSFKLMHLSDCTFLNVENNSSTSHEVTAAYLSEEIWWQRESILNFIAVFKHAASSSVFSFNFLAFLSISQFSLTLSLYLSISLSLSLSLIHKRKHQ